MTEVIHTVVFIIDGIVKVGLTQNNTTVSTVIVKKEHVIQIISVAHSWVLNSFRTTMEVYGPEE